ncbi:MAG TPA: glycosyltransferase [Bacilli bacterium]|nr:glycosyltransferase [Bacilli bacterium]
MKVSIITVCYNSSKTIEDTIKSVYNQTYKDIEYILVDGKSKDNTVSIIKKYEKKFNNLKYVSEKDNGLYDAMNKGISMATGDIIGILNSDDILANDYVIEKIVDCFKYKNCDGVYGNLVFMEPTKMETPVRNFISHKYSKILGWHPAHPTLYLKKEVYDKVGKFSLDYRIAADYDFMLRLINNNIKLNYFNNYIVKMRAGGVSTDGLKGYIKNMKEAYKVSKINHVKFSLFATFLRIIKTLSQGFSAKINKNKILKKLAKENKLNNKIGIDLLWVKPNKNGGSETLFRNVLDGLEKIDNDKEYYLIVSKSNAYSFEHYFKNKKFKKIEIDIDSDNLIQRLSYINFKFYKMLKDNDLDFCFFPTYAMPMHKNKSITTVTGILDIQAIHFPKYFSMFENLYFRMNWKMDTKVADKVVTISNYSKEDIETHYKIKKDSVAVVYATCEITDGVSNFKDLEKEFNIKKNEYYYTVSSLLPHKNLMTLIETMKYINEKKKDNKKKLVISGTGGKDKKILLEKIKEYHLEDRVILTRFVSNEERNSFYTNAAIFLFPSIFEGFGMPPVEAMMLGTKVLTTKEASLPEVTKNKAYYVNNPYDVKEWSKQIEKIDKEKAIKIDFEEYSKVTVANEYLELFDEVFIEKNIMEKK